MSEEYEEHVFIKYLCLILKTEGYMKFILVINHEYKYSSEYIKLTQYL